MTMTLYMERKSTGEILHQTNDLICRLMQLIQVAAMNSATLPPSNTLSDVVKISAQAPPLGGAIFMSFINCAYVYSDYTGQEKPQNY